MKSSRIEVIRKADARDVRALAGLLRREMPTELRGLTIYDCHGVENHVLANIDRGAAAPVNYHVAELDGCVAGAIEMKRTEEIQFLQYLAVAPEARGRGVGGRLLAAALSPDVSKLRLHVLETNALARSWYARLGMREVGEVGWWAGCLPAPRRETGFVLLDRAGARAEWMRLGFTQAVVEAHGKRFAVGVLGNDWLRFGAWELVRQAALLAEVDAEWPGRKALVLESERPPEDCRSRFVQVARAFVMEGELAELRLSALKR